MPQPPDPRFEAALKGLGFKVADIRAVEPHRPGPDLAADIKWALGVLRDPAKMAALGQQQPAQEVPSTAEQRQPRRRRPRDAGGPLVESPRARAGREAICSIGYYYAEGVSVLFWLGAVAVVALIWGWAPIILAGIGYAGLRWLQRI